MATKKNRTKANKEFNLKNYDRIEITVLKGQKEVIQKYASTQNKSVNNLFKSLVYGEMGIPEPTIDELKKD